MSAHNPPVAETDGAEARGASPLRQILAVWRPFYGRLAFGILIALASTAAGLALMGLAGLRIGGMALGIGAALMGMRAAGVGRIVLRYVERLCTHDATFRALASLRVWFFRRLAASGAGGLGFRRGGDLLTRLVSDIETLDNLYLRLAIPLAGAIITLPVLLWAGLHVSIGVGVALGVLFVLAAFVAPYAAGRSAQRLGPDVLHHESRLRERALDLASGLREARAFDAEDRLTRAVEAGQRDLFAAQTRRAGRMALAGGVSYLAGQAALLVVLVAIARQSASPVVAIGLVFLTITAFEGVSGLVRAGLLAGEVGHAAARITDAARGTPEGQAASPVPAGTALRLQSVRYRWTPDGPPVLNDLTLAIAPGERIAILGPSGAGKSTLAALLLKVTSPEAGVITLDGADIATLDDAALRGRIAWLSQHTHLFADTIRHNLTLGRTGLSDEALYGALDRAAVGDMVRGLPDGLDTWIGEGGAALSGGQGRRVALARTLLSDAPILVLDEPATGLDAETERAFLTTLNETTAGRTVVLIAHRLTGAESLDRVWVLRDGRLEAQPF